MQVDWHSYQVVFLIYMVYKSVIWLFTVRSLGLVEIGKLGEGFINGNMQAQSHRFEGILEIEGCYPVTNWKYKNIPVIHLYIYSENSKVNY